MVLVVSIPLTIQDLPLSYEQKSADVPTRTKKAYFLVVSNLKNLPTKTSDSHILVEQIPRYAPTKTSDSHFLVEQIPRYAPTKRRNSCYLVESILHQKANFSSFVRNKSGNLTTNNALQPPPTTAYPPADPASHA